ncbi:MAG TPA: hypothetical protein VNQ97_04815 [Burkholderiaceae bacterium]|nr:hypothetical protein [Burkholderiaceae bacterium]
MASLSVAGAQFSASDPGFAATGVQTLLAEHETLLTRIRLAYGTDRPTFDADVLSAIERYQPALFRASFGPK